MEQSKTACASLSRLIEQEESISKKHQLKCFFNHVLLGQWELAKSFSNLIFQGPIKEDRKRVLTALADIATNPYEQSTGSASVVTPEQLSWLALQEYERLTKLEPLVGVDLLSLRQDVEFRLLLILHFKDLDESILHEAYQYFQKHHGMGQAYSRVAAFDSGEPLPQGVIALIKQTLRERPAAGHYLITSLMPKQRVSDSKESETLQGLYVQSINFLLDNLPTSEDEQRKVCEKVFQLLAQYDPEPYWNYLQIRQLFTRLISLSGSDNANFSIERVLEALMGRTRGYLMDEFCKLLHDADIANPLQLLGDLPEEQRLTVHLLTGGPNQSMKDRDVCWQRYFLTCLKWNKHCVGLIMETCISLVMSEQFDVLGKLLSQTELQRLKPVVLLACWTYCKSSASARRLLDTLWTSPAPSTHPALTAGCQKLAYQLSLIKWCLERARPLLESSETAMAAQATYGERATRMLYGLETHSVLFVLHRSTQLAVLDSQEVLRLLHNVARDSGTEQDKKKQKSVRFRDNNSQTSADASSEPVNTEQEHDICIFRSYCAVKNVMDAIVFCYKHGDSVLMNPIVVRHILKPKKLSKAVSIGCAQNLSSSEGEESSTPKSDPSESERNKRASVDTGQVCGERFEEVYSRCVWQKIQLAREHLQHLHPLTYRVEVMENIFSLLFCRHSDLRDSTVLGEGESDDDMEGESILTDSVETPLNGSLASEDDPAEADRIGGVKESNGSSSARRGVMTAGTLKDNTSTSSSLFPANSAISSLSSDGKSDKCKQIDYDTPFPEKRRHRNSENMLKLKLVESSDGIQPFSSTDHCCGFLANEYVVRDILAMLKEALIDLNSAKFKLYGSAQEGGKATRQQSPLRSGSSLLPQSAGARIGEKERASQSHSSSDTSGTAHRPAEDTFSPDLEKQLSSTVRTSIAGEMMQKRIAQLTQHIHEAQWRFQLVTHEQFPRQPGKVLEEVVVVTNDDTYVVPTSDDWGLSSRNSTSDDIRSQPVRHSSRRRSVGGLGLGTNGLNRPCQQSIIARMLSSSESLLTMCLTRGNLPQAAQVIKLLKISEKTQEVAELTLTEKLNSITKSITALGVIPPRDAARTPATSVKFSLQAIKNAAAAGVANANLSSYIDDLLATPNIPPPPRPQWVGESGGQESVYAELFSVDVTTTVLLDLACSMCQSWDLCNNVFNIIKAKGKIAESAIRESADGKEGDVTDADSEMGETASTGSSRSKKCKGSKLAWKVKGCKGFFLQLDSLLQVGHSAADHWTAAAAQEVSAVTGGGGAVQAAADAGSRVPGTRKGLLSLTLPSLSQPLATASLHQSLIHHFCSSSSSLKASVMKQYDTSIREVQQSFEQANQALLGMMLEREDSFMIDESHFAKSPLPKQSPSSSLSFSPSTSRTSSMGSGGSSLASREATPGKAEIPLLHRRMKHLVATMEKHVPHDGLVKLFIHGRLERGMLKNYLLSTYEHVKELAFLVSECETKSSEMLVLPKNYFSVLQEGPVDILGRLVFVKRVMPAKLEKVANKLSLNLTHIIVQSCCPQIPSKHLPSIPLSCSRDVERVGAKSIYNSGHTGDMRVSDPEAYLRAVIKDLLAAMQDLSIKYNGRSIFTEVCGRHLLKSDSYKTFLMALPSLQSLNLVLLDSREKRLCFFTNLLNLMTLHFHLHNISLCMDAEENHLGKKGSEGLTWNLKGLDGKNLLDMVTKLGSFCYRVGQLGVISLYDLKYTMLHHGQYLSHKWKSLVTSTAYKLAPDDPMAVFMPPAEPRLLFVVSDGCLSSPPIQVLDSSKLSSQLETAVQSYLAHTVQLDPETNKVSLPFLMTCLDLEQPVKKHSTKTLFDNLLNFVAVNADPAQVQLLDSMMIGKEEGDSVSQSTGAGASKIDLSPLDISLTDFSTDFAFVLKMEDVAIPTIQCLADAEICPDSPKFNRAPQLAGMRHSCSGSMMSSFLPHHFLLDSCSSLGDGKVSMAEPASYKLTPVTLDYVREMSGLVATLLTLLCADELDDELDSQIADDQLCSVSLTRHRTSSDISVVDIRSYRYHRLVDDFPILQRHLLTYIVPLAGADNPEISHSVEPILKFVTNTINEDVKMCLFSLHNSVQFLDMLHTMTTRLVARRQWQPLVPVLRSIPEHVITAYPHLQLLHDFVVSCWAKEFSTALPKARMSVAFSSLPKPFSAGTLAMGSYSGDISLLHQLRRMYCVDTQARTVMAVCDELPVDWGLDLLELCLKQKNLQPGLRAALWSKLHYMSVYQRITTCIKTQQIKMAMQQSDTLVSSSSSSSSSTSTKELLQQLSKFEDWRHMASRARDDPKEVLHVLVQIGDFVVLRDWAKLHNLPHEIIMETEVWYLKLLLTADASDMKPAYQALEDLRKVRPADCLDVCQSLLQRLTDHRQVQFLIDYMLNNLSANLPPEDLESLRLRGIGAKALLCIPRSMRGEYSHLLPTPHLILEQLLMNMKAELAGQVFEKIRWDFEDIKESKLRVAQDQFNALLTGYARKALEVTVVQATDNHSSAFSSPRPGSTGSGSSREEGRITPSQRLAAEASKGRRRGPDTPVSMTSRLSTTPPSSTRSSLHRRGSLASVTTSSAVAGSTSDAVGLKTSSSSKFIVPAVAPTEEQWVPDAHTSVCMVCRLERFSMFNRRHHCRRCGRVVCSACSLKRSEVRGVSARTCDECFEQIFGPSESRARDEQEVYSQRMKESLSGASPNPRSSSISQLPNLRSSHLIKKQSLTAAVHHDVHEWKLNTDEGVNTFVRDEFYYEQAPSVSLCMSILQHHANAQESGQLILNMCDELSTYLQPLSPGVTNLEVDYGLVISIIRELLFRAKMIFLKGGDTLMIGKCDTYQVRVDLLKILLKDNYPDLPTLNELSKMDTARYLRDKLVKDQRLQLALEVCTKCGVESTGVWLAWGRACLRAGDFANARTKFAQCLKAPSDKNQVGTSTRLLTEIIDFLESLPSTGAADIQMLLSNPATLLTLATIPVPAQNEETNVESIVYKECSYYLRTYGTYSDYLRFLIRNGYWNKALKFVVDQRCSPEVFVESIVQSTVRQGEMTRLIEQMLMLDSSLEQWMPYLSSSCRYLLKAKHFHNLYSVQLVMKDYIRAAMTCITHFYQQGAQSYLDLAPRVHFLHIAQEHMNAFFDPMKWGAVRHPVISPITPLSSGSNLPRLGGSQLTPPASSTGRVSPHQREGPGSSSGSVAGLTTQLVISKEDIQRHLKTISLQIEVTQFLQDCLSRSGEAAAVATHYVGQTKSSGTVVPTLFGDQTQRKELAKMILMSGDKLSVSLDLMLRIIRESQLKVMGIVKLVVCEHLNSHKLKAVINLLNICDQRQALTDEEWDEVVSTALLEITDKKLEVKDETETLIKMIRKEQNKINALIMTGKLRSAYLTAAKTNRVQDISRIMAAAERMGQAAVRNICKKWLEQHQRN